VKKEMKHEIKYSPAYALLEVNLDPNEVIVAEAGAMVYMTPQINVKTRKREEKSKAAQRTSGWRVRANVPLSISAPPPCVET